ncbi:Hpt domain-containing protein [Methylobacterium nigriterrae]|uniref:Hpt domain-containing protein n=1 Tax=Methylobacterium nigriterrae TaxID=3127512 RepID=UPI00301379E9
MSPIIDRAHLAEAAFGDAELADECLALFAEQCRTLLPGITDSGRDTSARADMAHTLKGSALGVGATEVARASATIEDGLRSSRVPADALTFLERAVAAALKEIQGGRS